MILLRNAEDFDVVVLITQVLTKPAGVSIPPRAVLRRFFVPSNKSSSLSSSGSSFNSFHQKFGCLESFKPNAKYTFLLADTGETLLHRGIRLPVFALSGPSLTFSEKQHLCDQVQRFFGDLSYQIAERSVLCAIDAPQMNKFELQTLPFGENFNATCVADGDPLPQVMWYKDNYPVDIATNGRNVRVEVVQVNNHVREAILEIDNLVLLDNGDYICRAKNPLGTTQSLLQLRVTTAGVSLTDQELAMVFSTVSAGSVNTLWLQILFQFVFIALFGLIVVGIILVFRRKDRRAKQKRKIMRGNEVLLKSQYVQVNTFEPPPPPINSSLSTNRQPHYQKANFFTSAMPQTPNYARLATNEFNLDVYSDMRNEKSLEGSTTPDRPRLAAMQQPQLVNLSRSPLEPIEEQDIDVSSNFLSPTRENPNFL
ncbi:unnamed protein product [Hydatigera taeniaeformis]|uniref:Ig-like domain-containing protein n=1 Tax=Hydatigena taeniaeformis TaxID=6205 RepID=A0A0R3X1R3_HYDTA|nr:unnamed protein product [Hydatigera taeniaeformis]